MADEVTEEDIQKIIPDVVRQAYADEAAFIAARVEASRQRGRSLIQQVLSWVPYVDAVFDEEEIDVANATSDVNRESRVLLAIDKIEKGLGMTLDDETKASVREDIYALYDLKMDDLSDVTRK
jgi:hypothetical protein